MSPSRNTAIAPPRRRRSWRAWTAAGLVLLPTGIVAGCGIGGAEEFPRPIVRALVTTGGRVIVPAVPSRAACPRFELSAAEDGGRVALTLVEIGTGETCAQSLDHLEVSTTLKRPLAGRSLTDTASSAPVPYFDGGRLWRIGHLPPHYRFLKDSPFAPLSVPPMSREAPVTWSREYASSAANHADLLIIQNAAPAPPAAGGTSQRRVDVNGHAASLSSSTYRGDPLERRVAWTAGGMGFAVISRADPPLSEDELLRIARGLHR
ncbi:hypothetical protein ACQP1W_33220 [Spirillospora sp. CA-255316]